VRFYEDTINKQVKYKFKNLIIIISVLIFFTSCKRCEDSFEGLTNEELSFFSYKDGETLIFESNDNFIDTLRADTVFSYDEHTAGEAFDCEQGWTTKQFNISPRFALYCNHYHPLYNPQRGVFLVFTDTLFLDSKLNFNDFIPQNNILIHGYSYKMYIL
jgi:hypothetical protein